MSLSLSNRALLRGILAGAVVLTGTACSRSDRTESAGDTSAAVLPDTSSNAREASPGGTATGAVSDTAVAPAQSSSSTQPGTPARRNHPRAETAAPIGKGAAGYRSMERDTTNVPNQRADSARVTADTAEASPASSDSSMSETSAATSDSAPAELSASSTDSTGMAPARDTAAAGYAEMARDTSTVADQIDTAATPNGDVALQPTTDTNSRASAEVSAETGVATTDSTSGAGSPDSSAIVRVRPPEDSTEILGNVTTTDEAADETADEQVVRPEDRETVAASDPRTDEVGAAAIDSDVTGAEAVALLSRQGVRCAVGDPETNQAIRWDMSSTPITLNPCGMGSMNLSRIWTAK